MDGSSQLLTNIEFDEAKKGYNREQVDGFLRDLSAKVAELQDMFRHATQRAEEAESRARSAAEAQLAADQARTEAESARERAEQALADAQRRLEESAPAAATSATSKTSDVEAAAGVLAMAHRTAEAAIADAEVRARESIEQAEMNAAVIVLEAEQHAERLKKETADAVESLRAERVGVMEQEVRELAEQRDALEVVIVDLQDYVEAHKRRMRESVEALAASLRTDSLRFDPAPHAVDPTAGSKRARHIPDLLEVPANGTNGNGVSVNGNGNHGTNGTNGRAEATAVMEAEPSDGEAAGPVSTDDRIIDLADTIDDEHDEQIDLDEATVEHAPVDLWDDDATGASPLGRPAGEADGAMREFFDSEEEAAAKGGVFRRR